MSVEKEYFSGASVDDGKSFHDLPTWLQVLFVVALFLGGSLLTKHLYAADVLMGKPDIIEVMELRGEISRGTADAVKAQVEKINENPKIKAVLLIVDTPGGGATASAMIYAELAKLKMPVIGFCEYICASGGMYALMSPSVKFIAVGDETVAGSIGVIAHLTRYYRLLEWAKIDTETYKSGEKKDYGNPARAATENERKAFQSLVDELAQKFYGVVEAARPKADMAAIKPAGIFIGQAAVKVGLADAVMTREQAIAKAKELSGSKMSFTREELSKMAKAASETTAYKQEVPSPQMQISWMGDLHTVVEMLQEIRGGESVQVLYRMPVKF